MIRKAYSLRVPTSEYALCRAGTRYRWSGDGGGSVPAPQDEEKPLTPFELFLWIGAAVWVGLTFLALIGVIIFAHSPGNAN